MLQRTPHCTNTANRGKAEHLGGINELREHVWRRGCAYEARRESPAVYQPEGALFPVSGDFPTLQELQGTPRPMSLACIMVNHT